jgi:hypothetical protein
MKFKDLRSLIADFFDKASDTVPKSSANNNVK